MELEQSETIDSLRVHVRRGLDRFCLGQYFTEYGLQETVKLIPDNVDADNLEVDGLMDKKCPFQVFLKAVASEIVKEKGVIKGRKKRIKDYVEILQAFSSEWVEYIRKNMRKKQHAKMVKSPLGSPEVAGGEAGGTPLKRKGSKRGPRGPYKKRKQAPTPFSASSSAPIPTTPTSPTKKKKLPPGDIETARREFEAEKEAVMSKVPNRNKKLFNQVGFAKWGKVCLPAMILNPFAVPPGDIRDQWMKMFQNVVYKERIPKMGHLVWWIGPQTDGQSSYSVVPSHGFITYEQGAETNMHELPSKIKKLLDRGSELNKTQMEQVEALRILNELAMQPKEEREHPRSDFSEEDYWGLDDDVAIEQKEAGATGGEDLGDNDKEEEDDDEVAEGDEIDEEDEELLDDEEDLIESSLEGSSKKSKKRKKDQIINEDEDQTEIVYDEIEEVVPVPPEPPKKKKKKEKEKAKLERGRKKKKTKSVAGEIEMRLDVPTKEQKQSPIREQAEEIGDRSEGREREEAMDVEPSATLGETPAWSAGQSEPSVASPNSAVEDGIYGGHDSGEKEYIYPEDEKLATTTKKKDKKLKKKGSKKKERDVKEEKDDKKSKKKKKKDKVPKEPKKKSKAAEQADLERCEEEYLPLIEKLQQAKEKKDLALIRDALEMLLPVADSFTASFFSEYEIPKVMKQTKTVLEEAEGGDMSTYRKLWNKMKNSYAQKFKEMPEGFKAKKRRSIKPPPKACSDEEQLENAAATKEEETKLRESPTEPTETVSASDVAPDAAESRDIGPSSPPLRVPLKEGKRRLSSGSDQLTKTVEKTPAVKPKPKKFSVMDFMSKKLDNRRLSVGSASEKSSTTPLAGVLTKKTVPSWVTEPLPKTFDSFIDSDRREDRLFALEFLLQAAAHFPANKGVNEESVARSLETAIYDWSRGERGIWADVYWDKVHSIVAAITGKRDVGSVVEMIMEGSFASPISLIKLSFEDLEHSFEGRPFVLAGE